MEEMMHLLPGWLACTITCSVTLAFVILLFWTDGTSTEARIKQWT
jgi:hypothetical protein